MCNVHNAWCTHTFHQRLVIEECDYFKWLLYAIFFQRTVYSPVLYSYETFIQLEKTKKPYPKLFSQIMLESYYKNSRYLLEQVPTPKFLSYLTLKRAHKPQI